MSSSAPKAPHHPNREGNLPLRIAFIGVKAALHGHDRHALQHAADELTRVAHRGRPRKVGNGRVVERRFGLDLPGDASQSGAQDNAGKGALSPVGMDHLRGLGDLRG